MFGGSGEIRTHGAISDSAVFKTAAINRALPRFHYFLVDEVGFEPTMPEAADLQSAGVTNFPTHPWTLISCCFNKPLTVASDAVTR